MARPPDMDEELLTPVRDDIKYAVSWIDGCCELTVFEPKQACSVVLNRAMVEQLIELLKGQ